MNIKKKVITLGLSALFVLGFLTGVKANESNIVKGETSIQKSIEASKNVNSDTVVFASADSFADSLSAINLTNKFGAKLIVVDKSGFNSQLESYCKTSNITTAYIVGGKETFSKSYEDIIKRYCPNTIRLSGKNRYETNKKSLEESKYNEYALADGRNYPDALGSSAFLKSKGLGLLLVNGSKDYRNDIKGYDIKYIFGRFNSVRHFSTFAKRIGGYDRYDTNYYINDEAGLSDNLILASGKDFKDALIANNFVNQTSKANLVLVGSDFVFMKKGLFTNIYAMNEKVYNIAINVLKNKKEISVDKLSSNEDLVKYDSIGQKSTSYETQGWLFIKNFQFRIGKNFGKEGDYSLDDAQNYINDNNIYSKWNPLDNNDGKGCYIVGHGYMIGQDLDRDFKIGDSFSILDTNGNLSKYVIKRANLIDDALFKATGGSDVYSDPSINERLGNNLLDTRESVILSFCVGEDKVGYYYAEKIK